MWHWWAIFFFNGYVAICHSWELKNLRSSKNHHFSTLQVLDLGFNLIRVLPETAFKETKDLTLLALDGNPMAFIPQEALSHLNGSLRGLSLGGRFLTCDCKMRWVTEWIQNFDLQVTSRERNPQFCGNPQHLRDRNFYQLSPAGKVLLTSYHSKP